MPEPAGEPLSEAEAPAEPPASPAGMPGAPIRQQLLWAALFPLAFFGLLATLVTAASLYEMTHSLILQRNTARVQTAAAHLSARQGISAGVPAEIPADLAASLGLDPSSRLMLVAADHSLPDGLPPNDTRLHALIESGRAGSLLLYWPAADQQVILSYAPLSAGGILLLEPWSTFMTPAFYYQAILVALLALGTALSLGMLSLSVGRILRPSPPWPKAPYRPCRAASSIPCPSKARPS